MRIRRTHTNMSTETDYLKSIAEEIAATKNQTEKPNHHLTNEARRLEKAIIQNLNTIENFTQRDTFHFNTLSKLVHICDILFDNAGGVSPDVRVLIDLMTNVRRILPDEIRPNLKLPKAFIAMQATTFAERWAVHEKEMNRHGIEPALVEIAAIPVARFKISRHQLYWSDFTWLKGYLSKLDMMDWENADCGSKTEALMS